MTVKYVIQEVDGLGFYSLNRKRFGGYLFSSEFDTKEELLSYATKEKIKEFRITEIHKCSLL